MDILYAVIFCLVGAGFLIAAFFLIGATRPGLEKLGKFFLWSSFLIFSIGVFLFKQAYAFWIIEEATKRLPG